ncbi:diaminobutyrate acetyltransferase [Sediminimonas qiaohouensis]|uniref:diaminobutyrate acetyltransferase n=1 Tax=Sediminimonas qiaohouensis TaxID=552061 RepID=UPI0003F580CE|nr:diaminobutyrate acetyltransferase [Sediminimonas qiaohouensis]
MHNTEEHQKSVTFRAPTSEDGSDVWDLIRSSGPLDENSIYCNLVQCEHFADTCVIAELDGEIVGWISAFIPPDEADTLFVWQVAVGEAARGRGVAKKMLAELFARPACADVTQLKTTITADNAASWALFNSFAENMDAELEREPHYERDAHFGGKHATEYMVTIGEFAQDESAASEEEATHAN